MNRAQKILQAYRNTPWRRQIQVLSMFGAVAAVAALVMIVYIWVTSQAGTYGLQVREYQVTAQALEQSIEDKKVELADLTSTENLAERAEQAGYQPVDPNRIRYLEVEGYYTEPPLQLAPAPNAVHTQSSEGGLPQSFTSSLYDWIRETIYQLSIRTGSAGIGE